MLHDPPVSRAVCSCLLFNLIVQRLPALHLLPRILQLPSCVSKLLQRLGLFPVHFRHSFPHGLELLCHGLCGLPDCLLRVLLQGKHFRLHLGHPYDGRLPAGDVRVVGAVDSREQRPIALEELGELRKALVVCEQLCLVVCCHLQAHIEEVLEAAEPRLGPGGVVGRPVVQLRGLVQRRDRHTLHVRHSEIGQRRCCADAVHACKGGRTSAGRHVAHVQRQRPSRVALAEALRVRARVHPRCRLPERGRELWRGRGARRERVAVEPRVLASPAARRAPRAAGAVAVRQREARHLGARDAGAVRWAPERGRVLLPVEPRRQAVLHAELRPRHRRGRLTRPSPERYSPGQLVELVRLSGRVMM